MIDPLEHVGLAVSVADPFSNRGDVAWSAEDRRADAMVALVQATTSYRSDMGAFSTYAHQAIRNRLIDTVRRRRLRAVSMTDFRRSNLNSVPDGVGSTVDVVIADEDQKNRSRLLDRLSRGLSDEQRRVVDLVRDGRNQLQIAKSLGLSVPRVTAIINGSIKAMRREVCHV